MANALSPQKRTAVVSALVEGCSIRATARMTDTSKDTVMKLQRDLGLACIRHMEDSFRGLKSCHFEVDEVWSFCYAKEKNVPATKKGEPGYEDVWCFTAIDADSKLIPCFQVGPRDAGTATEFLQDLGSRVLGRVQVTTDGHSMYLPAMEDAFGGAVNYAQLVKVYGASPEGEHRYSPAQCIGCRAEVISGAPDPDRVSTSYVERSNLTLRMGLRRYTRLTNAFSKKLEHHIAALGLFFCFYNLCRIHKTLRVTPARAAGLTARPWSVADLVALLPVQTGAGKKRGPYQPRISN